MASTAVGAMVGGDIAVMTVSSSALSRGAAVVAVATGACMWVCVGESSDECSG